MNITEILDELGIPFARAGESEHVTANFIGLDCPWCADQNEFHLGYHLYKHYCVCWQCGPHTPAEVLVQISGISWGEAKRLLGQLESFHVESQPRPRGVLKIPYGVGPLLDCHRNYLKSRGFNPEKIESLWGIQGIGLTSRFKWRIWIPIHNQGKVVSWTTRKITSGKDERYMNAGAMEEAIPAKALLYGEDYAGNTVIVCEGPTDVWNIGPGAVATLGTSYSQAQEVRMCRYTQRYICFDAEPEAQKRANALCERLKYYPGKTQNIVLNAKDAGSATEGEIAQLRKLLR